MLSEINEIVLYQMILVTTVTVSFFHKDLLVPIKYQIFEKSCSPTLYILVTTLQKIFLLLQDF